MIVGNPYLLQIIQQYRCVWIGGRVGGNKTLLALSLAYTLKKMGKVKTIFTNFPAWDCCAPARTLNICDSVIIADEGGLFLKTRGDYEQIAAFLRKHRTILIVASVIAPAMEFRTLTIRCKFNLLGLGIPALIYSYKLNQGDDDPERGFFALINPGAIYGLIDTRYITNSDCGAGEFVEYNNALKIEDQKTWQTDFFESEEEQSDEVSEDISWGLRQMAEQRRIAEMNEQNAQVMIETAQAFERIKQKKR